MDQTLLNKSIYYMRILIVSNIDNFHVNFHLPLIDVLHKKWTVDLASKGEVQL